MSKFRQLIGVPKLGAYLLETAFIQATVIGDLAHLGSDIFLGNPVVTISNRGNLHLPHLALGYLKLLLYRFFFQ